MTSSTRPLLRPSLAVHSWNEEFRRRLRTLFGPEDPPLRLRLTVFDRVDSQLSRNGLDLDTVQAELRRGIVNLVPDKADVKGRKRYVLTAGLLDLWLHDEVWQRDPSGRTRLAVLDGAKRRGRSRPVDPYRPLVPVEVDLGSPGKDRHCDLTELERQVARHRRLAEAEHALSELELTPRRQSELRAQARKRYGSLRDLLELARRRAQHGDRLSRTGKVVPGPDLIGSENVLSAELVIALDHPVAFTTGQGDHLAVSIRGEERPNAFRLELLDATDEAVVLAWPERGGEAARARRVLSPGTPVLVAETDDFRYQRHLTAVRDFLDEQNIVGNWAALATLLCAPDTLPTPREIPEIPKPAPGSRALNDRQRQAVARALAAPYACLVQGPPGTGKTQVISELAARLVARGERVLLTAPTHVALDEVLRRLLDEPGVLPVRLSWKESLVDARVRHLTRQSYDHVLATDLRTPATSDLPQWQDRLDLARKQRDALVSWRESVVERNDATRAAAETHASFTRNEHGRAAEADRLHRWVARASHDADAGTSLLGQLRWERDTVEGRLRHLETTAGLWARALALFGLGELSALRARSRELAARLAQTEAGLRTALHHQRHAESTRAQTLRRLASEHASDTTRLALARERSDRARARAEAGLDLLPDLGLHVPDDTLGWVPAALASLENQIRELEARIDVQQRWFELTGMTGRDEETDRREGTKVVRPALVGAVNLVCATTTGSGGDPDFRDLDYDTLIVDEASKVTGAEFLIPARKARRWVMVGDELQLRPYVEPADEHYIHAMAALHLTERSSGVSLDEAVRRLAALWLETDDAENHPFRHSSVKETAQRLHDGGTWEHAHRKVYHRQIKHLGAREREPERLLLASMHEHQVTSLFEYCVPLFPEELRGTLIEQRRMPAQLAELVKQPVYQGRYETPEVLPPECDPLVSVSFPTRLTFLDTSAQPRPWHTQKGTTCFNELEADWVVQVCRSWNRELAHRDAPKVSVSILAFYGAQARVIRRRLGHPHYREFGRLDFKVVDAIDRIQGQESELVIVSFCRTFAPKDGRSKSGPPPAKYAPWLQNLNRLNVAVTRARRSLILVGHGDTLRHLRGSKGPAGFYDNLFGLLDGGRGGVLLKEFEGFDGRRR